MAPCPRLLLLICASLLIAAGCSSPAPSPPAAATPPEAIDDAPAHGDTLVEASIGDASNLLAILATDAASHQVSDLVFDGLVRYDGQNRVVGELAESWEISADGLEIVFHLKGGARFHDGVPVTAEDVVFTYDTIMAPETMTAYRGDFEPVAAVMAVDSRTVRVRYSEPFAPALVSWTVHVLPRHLLQGSAVNTSSLGRAPVGSGPFRFVEWVTGQRVVLERNPDYHELDPATGAVLPYLDRYVFRVVPDQGVQYNELLAGTLDAMRLKPLQWLRQSESERFRDSFEKYSYLDNAYT